MGSDRIALTLLGCAIALGCTSKAPSSVADDLETIHTHELAAVDAFNAGDIDGYMLTYPSESYWLPPGSPTVHGGESIRKVATLLAAGPDFRFYCDPHTIEISESGDLAYLVGYYELTFNDLEGARIDQIGKYTEVWKKHADGAWNHEWAMWSPDDGAADLAEAAARFEEIISSL